MPPPIRNVDAAAVQRLRGRLNTALLVLPGQWCSLMAVFWLRFMPPLRPFEFHAPAPDLVAFVLACAACFLPLLLPPRWFQPHPAERGLYRAVGIRVFRFLAPDGDFVSQRLRRLDPSYRVISTRTQVRDHLLGSRSGERSHLVLFLMGTCTQAFAWATGQVGWAVVLTLGNVLFNLYPILHQRHKRARAAHGQRLLVNG